MSEETYTVILTLKHGDTSYAQHPPLIFRKVELLLSQNLGAHGSGYEYNYLMALSNCAFTLNMEARSPNKTLATSVQAA